MFDILLIYSHHILVHNDLLAVMTNLKLDKIKYNDLLAVMTNLKLDKIKYNDLLDVVAPCVNPSHAACDNNTCPMMIDCKPVTHADNDCQKDWHHSGCSLGEYMLHHNSLCN